MQLVVSKTSIRSQRLRLAVTLAFLFSGVTLLGGCAQHVSKSNVDAIAIESVRVTAAGHYIDLRYRVLDPVAANALLSPGVKPTLIDESSGIVMSVPMTAKLGSLRQTRGEQRPDRSYFVLFANTAGARAGSNVTAVLGDMTFENLTIE